MSDVQPSSTPEQALGAEIVRWCLDAGFAKAGIATLEPVQTGPAFESWVSLGRHATMDWLAQTMPGRIHPGSMLPGAQAAVVVADLYASGSEESVPVPVTVGRIARYAQGRDYHDLVKKRLRAICDRIRAGHPGAQTRMFTDTAPVHERELAQRAGIGWTGKHTLTIDPQLGSWFVLGGFLTTLEIAAPSDQPLITDHCGTCTRCIEACPTQAITPYSVDASRCISYLTIEHEGTIEPELAGGIGQWFAGCDICQEICPHNRPRVTEAAHPLEGYTSRRRGFDLLEVLSWDEATRRARFATSALKRITLAQAQRNAIHNAEHALRSGELDSVQAAALMEALRDLAWNAKADPGVRESARALVDQIGSY